jgi:protein gp37
MIDAGGNPPSNLLLMASVWDQASADAACEAFSALPAGGRWGLHCEPLLGPVVLEQRVALNAHQAEYAGLRWVVVGGENGPGARPMDPQWAISLHRQCKAAGVPFWLKGWGGANRGRVLFEQGAHDTDNCQEVPW